MTSTLATVILAAGKGERMKSPLPKVLQEVGGAPLLSYPITLAHQLKAKKIIVVVGVQGDLVKKEMRQRFQTVGLSFVRQKKQKGTADAVRAAEKSLKNFTGDVLILYGDVPLLKQETLQKLIQDYHRSGASMAILTSIFSCPTGCGRIVRDASGRILRIVEEKEATSEEKNIREINAGAFVMKADLLFSTLAEIEQSQKTKEYYLTDLLHHLASSGHSIVSYQTSNEEEGKGVNTRLELSCAAQEMKRRLIESWIERRVLFEDPSRTEVGPDVLIGEETVIGPNCLLEGKTRIGARCRLESGSLIRDS
ncbi:MAG: NTP transferase domain-containing protein, partial [bacterium]|nr:NTP transferase domain-containing protein [bacterium]